MMLVIMVKINELNIKYGIAESATKIKNNTINSKDTFVVCFHMPDKLSTDSLCNSLLLL